MNLEEVVRLNTVPDPLAKSIPMHFRVGLIGAGRIVHSGIMPAYRSAGILPVAACDPDPEARAQLQALWGVPQVFEDYQQMMDAVDLDVVDINIRWDVGLSPTRVAAVAEAARRGLHVIIAKPLAETWEQCRAIVAHARSGGIQLVVDQNTRYAPAFYGCRSLIQHGALGELISASVHYHSALGRQHTNAFDAAHDVCVHGVDILLSWFEEPPVEVYARWSRRVDGIGSVMAAIFTFASGATGTLLYDFATRHRRQFEFIAVGDQASADGLQDQELPGPSRTLRATLRYGPHEPRGLALELPLQYAMTPGSFLANRADLFQCVEEKRQPWASGENILRTMQTLFAVKRSLAMGRNVQLVELDPVTASAAGA